MENLNKKFEQAIEVNPWEMSQDDFQSFSLEHINETATDFEATRERNLMEAQREVERVFEQVERGGEQENRNLFEVNEARGRENSNIFRGVSEAREVAEWQEYGANFAEYAGRENFISRNENRNRTAESLSREITAVKSQVRTVDFSQKISNLGRAIFGRVA